MGMEGKRRGEGKYIEKKSIVLKILNALLAIKSKKKKNQKPYLSS